jgi:hypothetical protein
MSNAFGSQQRKQIELAVRLINSGHHYMVGKRPKNSGLYGEAIASASCNGNRFTVTTGKGSVSVTFDLLQIMRGYGAGTIHLYEGDRDAGDATVLHIDLLQPNPNQGEFERLIAEAFRELGADWRMQPEEGFLE